jgi:hypothetical protein
MPSKVELKKQIVSVVTELSGCKTRDLVSAFIFCFGSGTRLFKMSFFDKCLAELVASGDLVAISYRIPIASGDKPEHFYLPAKTEVQICSQTNLNFRDSTQITPCLNPVKS